MTPYLIINLVRGPIIMPIISSSSTAMAGEGLPDHKYLQGGHLDAILAILLGLLLL